MRYAWLALLVFALPAQAQLMDAKQQAALEAALPVLANPTADDALHGRLAGKRLFYTGKEIPHASQDHSGAMNTSWFLSAHNRSAFKDGLAGTDFESPWLNPGGTDRAFTYAWKVMFLPAGTKIRVHEGKLSSFFAGAEGSTFQGRNASGGYNVNGYDWTFPEGTRFYELLSFGDRLRVFEVRTRSKLNGEWKMNVYRPFPTRDEFVATVADLPEQPAMKAWTLSTKSVHRNKTALSVTSMVEKVPGFESREQADKLMDRPFRSAFHRGWTDECSVPTTESTTSFIPKGYEGWVVGNDSAACMNCHKDAASHVRFFDASREWYGFVRGSKQEKILSFHPAAPQSLSGNGTRVRFQMNQRLVDAGLIEWRP